MHLGRLAIGIVVVGCVACGLAFSPGDYAASPPETAEPDATPEPDVAVPTDAGPVDAAVPSTRILLFAGRRDPVPGEPGAVNVAETMRTTLSSTGELGPWTFDVPPPQSTSWSRALLAGDTLLLQSVSVFLRAPFGDDHVGPVWTPLATKGLPETFMRPWIVTDAGLTAAGGASDNAFTTDVFVAPFLADGGVDGWQAATSSLVKARGDVTLVRYKDFLYALGGRDNGAANAPGRDEVEVARLAGDGTLGGFAATTKLDDPSTDAASFGVFLPVVAAGAGHLFVLGGQTTATSSSMTDVALAAKIDEGTGELGPWLALPKLPAPMNGAAAIVAGNTILVFGGSLGSTMSDAVLALAIQPDGTFGAEWKKIGSLPGPRMGLAALVY